MKQTGVEREYNIRQSHFPISIFLVTLVTVLLMSAIHMFLILAIGWLELPGFWETVIVIVYWVLVSVGFTLFTRYQMRSSYEKPMKELAKAADAVAHGDFSVYVPPIHTAEKLDYLDVMIMDFNLMVEELGSIETLKTDFFSNVSHEIKTPLSVILSYGECLRDSKLTEEERLEYVEIIIQSSKRLSKLITNILKLNKLEKQNIQPMEEAYDLSQQLCECALQFEDMWEEKHLEFEADIEDKIIIEADKSLMELVWNNLLSNAVKFTAVGGTITLQQTSTGDEVTVSVTDNGCGMEAETMNHIFDKFYQGDTSHSTEGNGLGLALALRVVQLSGGTITAWSEPGSGSCFKVCLPITQTGKGSGEETS